jgi:hypothetical protein
LLTHLLQDPLFKELFAVFRLSTEGFRDVGNPPAIPGNGLRPIAPGASGPCCQDSPIVFSPLTSRIAGYELISLPATAD